MSNDVLESGLWYKKLADRLIRTVVLLVVVIVLLTILVVLLWTSKDEPVVVGMTPDLRVVPLTPLTSPVSTSITNWTADTITRSLSFDFQNWKQSLTDVQDRYSTEGWQSFLGALKSSTLSDLVIKKRLVLQTTVFKAPVLVGEGVFDGVLSWKVEVPVLVSIESSEGVVRSLRWTADVLVQRADQATKPSGVEVHQVVFRTLRE